MASVVMDRKPDPEVELAIDLAVMCKMLKVLPRAGGLLDQDAYHIRLIRAGLNALAERERLEIERAKKK